MPFLSFAELEKTTCGRWLVAPGSMDLGVERLTDDSRTLAPGELFIAIKGELTDGHKYLSSALEKGAGCLLVQDNPPPSVLQGASASGCPCLKVEDSLAAYQQLALWHRAQFPQARILAITGSCGKTSTKEMCAAILEEHFPGGVLKTAGSTNNHFGVPRNLYRIDGATRVAVIEMGTNHPGEIASLVRLAPPEVGVVCNIGEAHLEFFHDLVGVAREKSSILKGILPGGTAVYPSAATGAEILRAAVPDGAHVLAFGNGSGADLEYEYLGEEDGLFRLRLKWRSSGEERLVRWRLGGAHSASNGACAALAATAFGCTPDEVVAGLQRCVLPGERMEVVERAGVHWVNDAFNANPTSMRAAIEWFGEVKPKGTRAILALGDMLELRGDVVQIHKAVLEFARKRFPEACIVAVGSAMCSAAEALAEDGRLISCGDVEEARARLMSIARDGDWILLKSSHGIGLTKLAPR